MKLAVSRAIVTYWNDIRGMDPAPTRAALKPGAISSLLPDLFILQRDRDGNPVFRLAGTRVCALMGQELRQKSFSALFFADQQHRLRLLINSVADRLRPYSLSLSPVSEAEEVELEMILLPMIEQDQDGRLVLGVLAPVDRNAANLHAPLRELRITGVAPLPADPPSAPPGSFDPSPGSLALLMRRLGGFGSKTREKTIN